MTVAASLFSGTSLFSAPLASLKVLTCQDPDVLAASLDPLAISMHQELPLASPGHAKLLSGALSALSAVQSDLTDNIFGLDDSQRAFSEAIAALPNGLWHRILSGPFQPRDHKLIYLATVFDCLQDKISNKEEASRWEADVRLVLDSLAKGVLTFLDSHASHAPAQIDAMIEAAVKTLERSGMTSIAPSRHMMNPGIDIPQTPSMKPIGFCGDPNASERILDIIATLLPEARNAIATIPLARAIATDTLIAEMLYQLTPIDLEEARGRFAVYSSEGHLHAKYVQNASDVPAQSEFFIDLAAIKAALETSDFDPSSLRFPTSHFSLILAQEIMNAVFDKFLLPRLPSDYFIRAHQNLRSKAPLEELPPLWSDLLDRPEARSWIGKILQNAGQSINKHVLSQFPIRLLATDPMNRYLILQYFSAPHSLPLHLIRDDYTAIFLNDSLRFTQPQRLFAALEKAHVLTFEGVAYLILDPLEISELKALKPQTKRRIVEDITFTPVKITGADVVGHFEPITQSDTWYHTLVSRLRRLAETDPMVGSVLGHLFNERRNPKVIPLWKAAVGLVMHQDNPRELQKLFRLWIFDKINELLMHLKDLPRTDEEESSQPPRSPQPVPPPPMPALRSRRYRVSPGVSREILDILVSIPDHQRQVFIKCPELLAAATDEEIIEYTLTAKRMFELHGTKGELVAYQDGDSTRFIYVPSGVIPEIIETQNILFRQRLDHPDIQSGDLWKWKRPNADQTNYFIQMRNFYTFHLTLNLPRDTIAVFSTIFSDRPSESQTNRLREGIVTALHTHPLVSQRVSTWMQRATRLHASTKEEMTRMYEELFGTPIEEISPEYQLAGNVTYYRDILTGTFAPNKQRLRRAIDNAHVLTTPDKQHLILDPDQMRRISKRLKSKEAWTVQETDAYGATIEPPSPGATYRFSSLAQDQDSPYAGFVQRLDHWLKESNFTAVLMDEAFARRHQSPLWLEIVGLMANYRAKRAGFLEEIGYLLLIWHITHFLETNAWLEPYDPNASGSSR